MEKEIKMSKVNEMKEIPLISVIVPIYNVQNYLKRCIDSIINQTYSNLEIILVDDGSSDNCPEICDQYQGKDSRIRVVHKKNGGLSDARNAGLDIMRGEFVTCIDSDDFVSPYFIENLWNAIREYKCDIATSWFVEYYEGDSVPKTEKLKLTDVKPLNREDFYEKLLYQDGVEISAWGKLYKSSLFQGVRYPVGKLYEDIPTTYLLIEKVTKIAVFPNADYYYFQRKTSIAQAEFSVKKMDAINHMRIFKNFIVSHYPNLKMAAECRYFSTVCNILFQIREAKFEDQKKELWNEVKKYRYDVLINKKGRSKARIAAFLSYGGYNLMQFIYDRTQ